MALPSHCRSICQKGQESLIGVEQAALKIHHEHEIGQGIKQGPRTGILRAGGLHGLAQLNDIALKRLLR
jgi:hypothetical protein